MMFGLGRAKAFLGIVVIANSAATEAGTARESWVWSPCRAEFLWLPCVFCCAGIGRRLSRRDRDGIANGLDRIADISSPVDPSPLADSLTSRCLDVACCGNEEAVLTLDDACVGLFTGLKRATCSS